MPVVQFDMNSKQPYAGGASFGETGTYTRIDGRLTFAVDPTHEANATRTSDASCASSRSVAANRATITTNRTL